MDKTNSTGQAKLAMKLNVKKKTFSANENQLCNFTVL